MYISNTWDSGSVYTEKGMSHDRPYWISSSGKYAMWHDGHTGADSDWMFGLASNVGGTHQTNDAKMASDEEASCPTSVSDWTGDDTATVSCTIPDNIDKNEQGKKNTI